VQSTDARKNGQGCYSVSVRKFCVYANSYVRNAIQETFLRTKNRKFVCKYTHGVSCCTTEHVCKDSELLKSLSVKLPRCLVFITLNTHL